MELYFLVFALLGIFESVSGAAPVVTINGVGVSEKESASTIPTFRVSGVCPDFPLELTCKGNGGTPPLKTPVWKGPDVIKNGTDYEVAGGVLTIKFRGHGNHLYNCSVSDSANLTGKAILSLSITADHCLRMGVPNVTPSTTTVLLALAALVVLVICG